LLLISRIPDWMFCHVGDSDWIRCDLDDLSMFCFLCLFLCFFLMRFLIGFVAILVMSDRMFGDVPGADQIFCDFDDDGSDV